MDCERGSSSLPAKATPQSACKNCIFAQINIDIQRFIAEIVVLLPHSHHHCLCAPQERARFHIERTHRYAHSPSENNRSPHDALPLAEFYFCP